MLLQVRRMNMKKLLSLILVLCLIVALLPAMPAAASESVSYYQTEIDFLKEAGLLKTDSDPLAEITRAQMAELVINCLYPDFDMISGDEAFADVASNHPYYAYIKACKDLKIANGDGNNCYNPDRIVTTKEMLTVMVNALGYTLYANSQGGYPTGYYVAAKTTGISTGVDLSKNTVDFATAAKILYNSLFVSSVEIEAITEEGFKLMMGSGKSIVSSQLGIYEYDAVIIDDGYTSIYGSSIGDAKRVVIEEYDTGMQISAFKNDFNFSDYLGVRVKVFVKNNVREGRYEVVFVVPYSNMNIVTLSADKIISKTSSSYEYDENGDGLKTKTYYFSNISPKIIINGAVITNKTPAEAVPDDGLVRLIDNDGNSRYDIIDIISFNYRNGDFKSNARNLVVDTVNTNEKEEYISCIFNPSDSLDINSDENIYIFKMSDGVTELSDIKEMNIVSVAECPVKADGKTLYYLVVSDETVNGTVTSKTADKIIINDETEYEFSTSITSVKKGYISLIDYNNITIYLDATGKIAYSTGATNPRNFGYLINAALDNSFGGGVCAKLFTKEGTVETLKLKDKVIIDGKTRDTSASQLTALFERSAAVSKLNGDTVISRPVIYKTNADGYIIEVDTDTPNHNYTGTADANHLLQTSIPYTSVDLLDPETLNAGWRNPALEKLNGNNRSVNGKFFLTMATRIIAVPEIDTYGLIDANNLTVMENVTAAFGDSDLSTIKAYELENTDENYKIVYANELTSGVKYDVQAYNIDPDTGVADFAVIRGLYEQGISSMATTAPTMIFLKKTTVYDSKSEQNITRIYYSNAGVTEYCDVDTNECFFGYKYLIEGATASENVFGTAVKPLRAGDVIRVTKDSENYMTHIERVISVAEYSNLHSMIRYPDIPANGGRYKNKNYASSNAPFDFNNATSHTDDTYSVCVSYVEQIRNGVAKFLVTDSKSGTLNDLRAVGDSTKIAKNNPFMYLNFGSSSIIVADIAEDGKSVKVKTGTINDIKTLENADYSSKESSIVMFRFAALNVGTITVINGIENVR